jgi:hypothetical protein
VRYLLRKYVAAGAAKAATLRSKRLLALDLFHRYRFTVIHAV